MFKFQVHFRLICFNSSICLEFNEISFIMQIATLTAIEEFCDVVFRSTYMMINCRKFLYCDHLLYNIREVTLLLKSSIDNNKRINLYISEIAVIYIFM